VLPSSSACRWQESSDLVQIRNNLNKVENTRAPYSAIFLPVGSLLILGLGRLFSVPWRTTLWLLHTVLSPSYTGVVILGHLGSPWQLFCGVPTASHPHPWIVPYLDKTDTRDLCLLVVFPYVP